MVRACAKGMSSKWMGGHWWAMQDLAFLSVVGVQCACADAIRGVWSYWLESIRIFVLEAIAEVISRLAAATPLT
jgi:hypothetical protein